MPVSANTLRILMTAGLAGDDLIAAVEAIDADMEAARPVADSVAERRRAYDRQRKADQRALSGGSPVDMSGGQGPDSSKEVPPHPPKKYTPKTSPKGDDKGSEPEAASDDVATAFQAYTDLAKQIGCAVPRGGRLDADRRAKLRARLADHGLDGWHEALARCRGSPFLRGEVATGDRTAFRLSIDFLLAPAKLRSVLEGKYDAQRSANPNRRRDPTLAALDRRFGRESETLRPPSDDERHGGPGDHDDTARRDRGLGEALRGGTGPGDGWPDRQGAEDADVVVPITAAGGRR